MNGLPLLHRIAGQPVVVLGTGEAADAKRRLVTQAGGQPHDRMAAGARLAFVGEVADPAAAAAALRAAGLLVNVVDRPDLSDFTVPAIVDRAPVTVAIATGGATASLAKALKERLELLLPPMLGRLAEAIARARPAVAARHADVAARRQFWAGLLAPAAPLDPLAPVADPQAAIESALAGAAPATGRVDRIHVGAAGAEGLTLAELRLLAAADLVLFTADVPASVLAHVRRDAARRPGDRPPPDASGRIVLLSGG